MAHSYVPGFQVFLLGLEPPFFTQHTRGLIMYSLLRRLRQSQNMSLAMLARELGISVPALHLIETGKTKSLRAKTKEKLEAVFPNVSADRLLADSTLDAVLLCQ